jgi:hypothetical protein
MLTPWMVAEFVWLSRISVSVRIRRVVLLGEIDAETRRVSHVTTRTLPPPTPRSPASLTPWSLPLSIHVTSWHIGGGAAGSARGLPGQVSASLDTRPPARPPVLI